MTPTQNEVVLEKSLPFTLERPDLFANYVSSYGPFKVGVPNKNDAIVTLNNKFVIDGHHRWSSLFCFNPFAKISSWNINAPQVSPEKMLKAAQISIWSVKPAPGEAGGGVNLFQATKDDVSKAVKTYAGKLVNEYMKILKNPKKGMAVAEAGLFAKKHGFETLIITNNIYIFDPTWFKSDRKKLINNLKKSIKSISIKINN